MGSPIKLGSRLQTKNVLFFIAFGILSTGKVPRKCFERWGTRLK